MRRLMILIAAGTLLAIAACNTAQNNGKVTAPSASPSASTPAASSDAPVSGASASDTSGASSSGAPSSGTSSLGASASDASASPAAPKSSAETSAPETSEKDSQPLKAAHISFRLPKAWTLQEGEESFAFQSNGKPVGGLDGLGYSDTLDGLLPNGALVEAQTELKDLPVKAIETKLNLEGQGDDETREEWHYYFFLPDEKAVYDLHFDAKLIKQEEARNIAKTAAVAAK